MPNKIMTCRVWCH